MMTINHLTCSICGRTYAPDPCNTAAPPTKLIVYRFEDQPSWLTGICSDRSIWRYAPLLPVADPGFAGTPLHRVGGTPVYELPGIRRSLGMPKLWVKDESPNPSASFKDRASAIVIAAAISRGEKLTVAASTGNAGAAMACMAAATGQKCLILAPRTAPPAKVAHQLFWAQVVLVDRSYDDAFELSLQATEAFGGTTATRDFNYLTAEGKRQPPSRSGSFRTGMKQRWKT